MVAGALSAQQQGPLWWAVKMLALLHKPA